MKDYPECCEKCGVPIDPGPNHYFCLVCAQIVALEFILWLDAVEAGRIKWRE